MRLFRTIKDRIFITLSFTIVVISLIVYFYFVYHLQIRVFGFFDSVNQTINTMLVSNIRGYVYNQDKKNMKLFLDSIESEYLKNILILDVKGRVIAQKNSHYLEEDKYKNFEILRSLKNQSIKTKIDYKILTTFEFLDVTLGYLVIEGDIKKYQEVLKEETRSLMLFVLIVVTIMLFVSYFISITISKPVVLMVSTLQSIKENEQLHFDRFFEEEFIFLARSIEEKHNALISLYENLEKEVAYKTKELQELNDTLEIKIEESVKDIQLKDHLIQEQTRFVEMGKMLSMIAHQWRQPLAAISTSVLGIQIKIGLQLYNLEDPKKQKDFLEYLENKLTSIHNYVQALSKTIDTFRNYFRNEQEMNEIVISEPIENALYLLEALIDKYDIEIDKKFESQKKIFILKNEFIQVVMNIITNANDALIENNIEHKKIQIHTYDTDNSVTVKICDNGGGVAKDIIGKIFDPYFSTKNEKNGTGMGLYMAKMIIGKHHNASINVFSKNKKTYFTIKFSDKSV